MKGMLYILAVLLIIVWILGAFIFAAGLFIHILLIVAVIFYMQALIVRPNRKIP